MADTDNKDVRLKDANGTYLYPLSREDDEGEVFKNKYLVKNSIHTEEIDDYVKDVHIEESSEGEVGIQTLVLTTNLDPSNPIRFQGGSAEALWGQIRGNIEDQGDLTLEFKRKNNVYYTDAVPEGTSEKPLVIGDLWYCSISQEEYVAGHWYMYTYSEGTGYYWVEVDSNTVYDNIYNSSRVSIARDEISTEVTARVAGEGQLYSTIDQTANEIWAEVGNTRTIWTTPATHPPLPSSEYTVVEGDLWISPDAEDPYLPNTYYYFEISEGEEGHWRIASAEEYNSQSARVAMNRNGITAEVARATGEESRIDVKAEAVTAEVTDARGGSASLKIALDGINTKVSRKTAIIESATVPESGTYQEGDLWHYIGETTSERTAGRYYRYNGSSWVLSEDAAISTNTTAITQTATKVGMVVGTEEGEDFIKAGEIALAINTSGDTNAKIAANKVDISGTATFKSFDSLLDKGDDTTTIKGGMITAGSITAGKIAAGAIDTEKLSLVDSSGKHVGTWSAALGLMTSDESKAGNMYVDKIYSDQIISTVFSVAGAGPGYITIPLSDPLSDRYAKLYDGGVAVIGYNESEHNDTPTIVAGPISWYDLINSTSSGTVKSVGGGTGITISGTSTINPVVNIDTSGASTGDALIKTDSGVGWGSPVAVFG